MPLGFERLNERSLRSNNLINFIKPLESPDKAIAEDYLNRIAAQCHPIMKAAHISVMSLEEFPPNNEFLGRNFNAGECIQLVLKDKSGRWLGFKYVQMVMMHELAHCKQMNHSKYFWQVRNQYAAEMYELWHKKYLGEGVWGRGQDLGSGSFVMNRDVDASEVPEHLCGGTYRRRGRKRKRGAPPNDDDAAKPTHAERQQRRIAKKFGKHGDGNTLGEDELVRDALEASHRHQGKPRVAGSKRGRELRAQAALARFGAAKVEQERATTASVSTDDDSDVEWSDSETDDELQSDSNGFVKVCDEEDPEDEEAHNEMEELQTISTGRIKKEAASGAKSKVSQPAATSEKSNTSTSGPRPGIADPNTSKLRTDKAVSAGDVSSHGSESPTTSKRDLLVKVDEPPEDSTTSNTLPGTCPVCSLENKPGSLLCLACSHVLRPKLVKGTWRCRSDICQGSVFLNAGDVGRCGICGQGKPAANVTSTKPISADVLRWD